MKHLTAAMPLITSLQLLIGGAGTFEASKSMNLSAPILKAQKGVSFFEQGNKKYLSGN